MPNGTFCFSVTLVSIPSWNNMQILNTKESLLHAVFSYCVWNFKREPRGGTTLKERTRRNGTLRTMSNWVVYFRAIVSSVASLLITWLTFGSILYSVDYCQYCVRVTIHKTKQINDRQPEYGLVPLANFRYDFSVGLQTKIKFRITRLTIGRIKKSR